MAAPSRRAVLFRCGGGHAASIYDSVATSHAAEIAAGRAVCWDDGERVHPVLVNNGWAHVRSSEGVAAFLKRCGADALDVFIVLADPGGKLRLAAQVDAEVPRWGLPTSFPVILGKDCQVSFTNTTLGRGAYVGNLAVVSSQVHIGDFAHVGALSLIGHDVVIGEGCHLGGTNSVGGFLRIGRGVKMGLAASVRDRCDIADWSRIGMHAAVSAPIKEPGLTWVGIPAKAINGKL
ncbi:trimeric LpxA-like protein [Hyaloraphidium curvatum]|nr:trimeric LpxA-like protein [Hyaloraphidium curvatum]